MFRKLFRYEWKHSARFGWWLLLGVLIAGVFAAASIFMIVRSAYAPNNPNGFFNSDFPTMAAFFALVPVLLVAVGASIALFLLLIMRYSKSTSGDEAYLTFTLPVSVKDILLSKLVNAVLWILLLLVDLVLFACLCVGSAVLSAVLFGGQSALEEFWYFVEAVREVYGIFSMLFTQGTTVETAIASEIVLGVQSLLFPFVCIAVCFYAVSLAESISKKRKVLFTLLILLGVWVVRSVLNDTLASIAALYLTDVTTQDGLDNYVFVMLANGVVQLLYQIVLAVGGFFLTKSVTEKKLNLE